MNFPSPCHAILRHTLVFCVPLLSLSFSAPSCVLAMLRRPHFLLAPVKNQQSHPEWMESTSLHVHVSETREVFPTIGTGSRTSFKSKRVASLTIILLFISEHSSGFNFDREDSRLLLVKLRKKFLSVDYLDTCLHATLEPVHI